MDFVNEFNKSIEVLKKYINDCSIEDENFTNNIFKLVNNIGITFNKYVSSLENIPNVQEYLITKIYELKSTLNKLKINTEFDYNYFYISSMISFLIYSTASITNSTNENLTASAMVLSDLIMGIPNIPEKLRGKNIIKVIDKDSYMKFNVYQKFITQSLNVLYIGLSQIDSIDKDTYYSWLKQYDEFHYLELIAFKYYTPWDFFNQGYISKEEYFTESLMFSQLIINTLDLINHLIEENIKIEYVLQKSVSLYKNNPLDYVNSLVNKNHSIINTLKTNLKNHKLSPSKMNEPLYGIGLFADKYLDFQKMRIEFRLLYSNNLKLLKPLEKQVFKNKIINYIDQINTLLVKFKEYTNIDKPLDTPFSKIYTGIITELYKLHVLLSKITNNWHPCDLNLLNEIIDSTADFDIAYLLLEMQINRELIENKKISNVRYFKKIDEMISKYPIPERKIINYKILKIVHKNHLNSDPTNIKSDVEELINQLDNYEMINKYLHGMESVLNNNIELILPKNIKKRAELWIYDSKYWTQPDYSIAYPNNKINYHNFNLSEDKFI